MKTNIIHCGDAIIALRTFPDNSVDTLIADPPYGLSAAPDIVEVLTHWLAGDDYEHKSGGFMSKKWDSFVPGPVVWRECLRVLKPGGTALIFGGTRTHDLLTIALRMAGFEIRDCLMWLHGQGFPKSHNIGKAIDKAAGREREVIGENPYASRRLSPMNGAVYNYNADKYDCSADLTITAPATPEAAEWEGYGTGLSPAWEPIIVAMKPREGTFAENALEFGVAGFWIDGGKIGDETVTTHNRGNNGAFPKRPGEKTVEESGRKKDQRHIETNPRAGRWPANVLFEHLPGCVRRGVKRVKDGKKYEKCRQTYKEAGHVSPGYTDPDGKEEVADWQCVDGCPVKALDEQAGNRPTGGGIIKKRGNEATGNKHNVYGKYGALKSIGYTDEGGPSRFYYCAKSSKSERSKACDDLYWQLDKSTPTGIVAIDRAAWEALPEGERTRGNVHPTVKPVNLLTYLARLTRTPTGGIILDPFAGSCSTSLAAIRTGREYIMIEREPEYVAIGQARIDEENRQPMLPEILDDLSASDTIPAPAQATFDFDSAD